MILDFLVIIPRSFREINTFRCHLNKILRTGDSLRNQSVNGAETRLHDAVHAEDGHVDGDDDIARDGGHDDQEGRLQLRDGGVGRRLKLDIIIIRDGVQGGLHLAGLFTDRDHVDQDIGHDAALAHAGAERMALFELAGILADLLTDKVVVDDLGRDGDGLGHGKAGTQHGGHGVGKLACGAQLGDLTEDRQFQLRLGEVQAALLGVAVDLVKQENGNADAQHDHPVVSKEVGDRDQGPGDGGEFSAVAVENGGEGRDDLDHQDGNNDDGDDHDKNRVGQGAAHFGAHLGLFVKVIADRLKGRVQAAGLFAGADGLDKGGREELASPLLEAGGDGAAGLHVGRDLIQDALDVLVGGLGGDELDGTGDGDTGLDDDGELVAHEGEGLHVQLGAADVLAQEAAFLVSRRGDLQDDIAGFADAIDGLHLVIGIDHAVDAFAAF